MTYYVNRAQEDLAKLDWGTACESTLPQSSFLSPCVLSRREYISSQFWRIRVATIRMQPVGDYLHLFERHYDVREW
jgi:hypothetical protein